MVLLLLRERAEAISATIAQLTEETDPSQLHRCYNIPYGVFGLIPQLVTYISIVTALAKSSVVDDDEPSSSSGAVILMTIAIWLSQVIPAARLVRDCPGLYRTLGIWKLTATFSNWWAQQLLRFVGRYVSFAALTAIWAMLLVPGFVPGIISMYQLVQQNWHLAGVRSATWAYFAFAILNFCIFAVIFVFITMGTYDRRSRGIPWLEKQVGFMLAILVIVLYYMMAGYADWVIAVTVHNIGGLPPRTGSGFMYFFGSISSAVLGFL